MPIREITRRTELSCNTVRTYLASSEQEQRYRRSKFPSKLSDYEQAATNWLHSTSATSAMPMRATELSQLAC